MPRGLRLRWLHGLPRQVQVRGEEPLSNEQDDGLTDEEFRELIREAGTPAEKFMINRIVRQRKQITALEARLKAVEEERDAARADADRFYKAEMDWFGEAKRLAASLAAKEQELTALRGLLAEAILEPLVSDDQCTYCYWCYESPDETEAYKAHQVAVTIALNQFAAGERTDDDWPQFDGEIYSERHKVDCLVLRARAALKTNQEALKGENLG